LAEVESLLGGVTRHTSLLFGLVVDGPESESEEKARTRLAGAAIVCPVNVGKACKLETVVRAPSNVRRMSMVPWRYRSTFFRACMWASLGDAWAEPRVLNAVDTSGRVHTAA
jgi:hypothetical protein